MLCARWTETCLAMATYGCYHCISISDDDTTDNWHGNESPGALLSIPLLSATMWFGFSLGQWAARVRDGDDSLLHVDYRTAVTTSANPALYNEAVYRNACQDLHLHIHIIYARSEDGRLSQCSPCSL